MGAGSPPAARLNGVGARRRRDGYGVGIDASENPSPTPSPPAPNAAVDRHRVRATRVLALFTALAAALLILGGCGDDDSDDGDEPETLKLVSDPEQEVFDVVDLGEKGRSVGDIYVFDGPMLDPDTQEVAGHVYGTQTALSTEPDVGVVQALITYEIGEGSQILVAGTAEYPADGGGLVEGQEYVRPILGGTGEYAGVSGTMTTVRQSDGSYEQTFEFGD